MLTKSATGWWLAKTPGGQAWVPAAYVEEQAPAPAPVAAPRPPPPPPSANGGAARAKPSAPQPPAKRPAAGKKPAGLQARDSGMSLNGSDSSRSNTPTPSLAGSLADALLARKQAMAKKDDDDDW